MAPRPSGPQGLPPAAHGPFPGSAAGGPGEPRAGDPRRSPRIYFVGAHATGKTTLARYVSDRYGLKLISEVARSVLAEMEVSLDHLRANLDAVNRYQVEVFRRQIEAEREAGEAFVSDRAFCNLAYTANHGTVMHELFRDPALDEYMRWVSSGLVFFVRPHPDLIQGDGVRAALRWEDVVVIDGMVKLLLEMYAIPYIIVATLSMQERARLADEVIRIRYPEIAHRRRGATPALDLVSPARVPRAHRAPADGEGGTTTPASSPGASPGSMGSAGTGSAGAGSAGSTPAAEPGEAALPPWTPLVR